MMDWMIGIGVLLACGACAAWGWARGYALGRVHGEDTTLRRVTMALDREVVGGTGPTEAPDV